MKGYYDLREHIRLPEKRGLLVRIKRAINKDTEFHPLARWQFRSNIPERVRKGFFFENVVDSRGKRYAFLVAAGILASSSEICAEGAIV
jgi:4-hydroxy-3-polyprenylbenzoate decarboxylase